MIDPKSQIKSIESRAKAAGIPMSRVLHNANVAETTWWRWRHGGVEPKHSTLVKVIAALDGLTPAKPSKAA